LHFEAGGLSTGDLLSILQGIGGNALGAELVAFHPPSEFLRPDAQGAVKAPKKVVALMMAALITIEKLDGVDSGGVDVHGQLGYER
jgi:hypothetical protein